MKENYVYSNGKVLIYDDNQDKEMIEREYQDNINEILETENIIEALEIEKENYETSIILKKIDIKHNKNNNKVLLITSGIVGIIIMLGESFINPFAFTQGLKWWLGILASVGVIGLTYPNLLNNSKKIKEMKNEINGIDLALNKLEKELIKNKKSLINLKNDKTKHNELNQTNKVKKVNYLTKLKSLKRLLTLYSSIGCNEQLFKEYYEKGLLETKLDNVFNQQEINEIKKYYKTK